MATSKVSRRNFLSASALGPLAGAAAVADPGRAAAQAVGVKPADLPDLTIKEVKVYVLGRGQLASIVTNSGIEGNYTLANRYWHPNWSNQGWLDYAKRTLARQERSRPSALTSQWDPEQRRLGQSSYASAIDNCLWDILGKAVGLPVYRILGAYRDKVLAYASSQHLETVEDFVEDVKKCKAEGFTAYKIHPPELRGGTHDYKLDIEVFKAVRQAAGDDFHLLHDPVGVYTRDEAIKVGRVVEELDYVAYEDPIPTTDIDGLWSCATPWTCPSMSASSFSPSTTTPSTSAAGRVDVVRFIVDNIGGITGGMKVAHLAECFGMECVPHNWGEALDHAVHFHCELAMPNNVWFEMTVPQGTGDRPYMKDHIRIDKDGYVHAPTKPGLGYEIDRAALDKLTKRIDR